MPPSRLLFLIIGIAVILGLILWLIDTFYRLYIAISSPFIGSLLVWLLLIVVIGLLVFFFYYWNNLDNPRNLSRSRSRYSSVVLPSERKETAEENLQAIKKQVNQIQDEVSKKVLLQQSKELEDNLRRGELKVGVFGTGSSGKTSVINALLGQLVGEVSPIIGTTQKGEDYLLSLPGVNRAILIRDAPGILEVGEEGTERGQIARELATSADLLLFIVDNDLRYSEYEPLKTLSEMGKRSILVFNKADLYTISDQKLILYNLRQRVKDFISPKNVIAVSANPQRVELETGELVDPEPEIMPLIKRLIVILRAEGDDLLADNILLQSQRLGEQARTLIDRQRRKQAEKIIDRYQWIGAGIIAVTPLPVVDLLATVAINAQMVIEIGQVYGCQLNKERGTELAVSLGKTLVSLGIVKGAVELIAHALQLTVATYIIGKAIQGVTAAYVTRIAGKSFIEYFRQDQDWGDGGITEVVQRQFQLSKKDQFLQGFIQDAINKVVQPLKESLTSLPEEDRYYTPPNQPEKDDW